MGARRSPEYLKQCVDKSLKRLKLERIDLYQLHRVDSKVPMEDSLGALKEAQGAGKIRHIGLSEVSPEQVQRARKIVPIAIVQNRKTSLTENGTTPSHIGKKKKSASCRGRRLEEAGE